MGRGGWADTEVSVRLRRVAGGRVRVEGELCRAPVWVRWDGATLWLVGSGATPVGQDHITVRVEVGAGVTATVRSVAATVVYAASGPGTRWDTVIDLAPESRLDWRPEPQILTQRARHRSTTTVNVAGGAELLLDEVVVMGRVGEPAGTVCSTLSLNLDDSPILITSFDTSLPGWAGPAGTNGASVVANRLRFGGLDSPEPSAQVRGAALLRPAAGCRLAVASAARVDEALCSLDAVLPLAL